MKTENKFNLGLVSKFRNEMFGLSIISIMIFHFFLRIREHGSGTLYPVALAFDNIISSVGVECFLFLSGVGIYFSMSKNGNILNFYRKRMSRVLIPYALWGAVFWIALDLLAKGENIGEFLYDFSFLSFWLEGDSVLWYIAFIVIVYLAFPLIFKMFSGKYATAFLVLSVGFSIGLSLVLRRFFPVVYGNIEIAVNRIPIFLFGAYSGRRIYKSDSFKIGDLLLILLGIAVHIFGILQRYGVIGIKISFSRYEFALFSISLIYICVWLLSKVNLRRFKAFLRGAGALSLELYMTHVTIDNLLRFCKIPTYSPYYYAIIIILSIIFSIFLHFSLKNIIIKINSTHSKN